MERDAGGRWHWSGGGMWSRDTRGRWHRSGQGLRRGILLGLRETAKSIAAGPELAFGSDSRPCRNNAVSRSPSSNHPSSAAARPDATFLWRPSTTSIHTKKSPASSYSKDTELPSVIYKLEMRLELTTPSLRVKCSTD